MSDWGDWADETDNASSAHWSRLGALLILVLLVAGTGCVLYVTLVVGSRVAHVAGSLVVHTARSKASPDGRWALVIDTVDKGAMGGFTSVYLESAAAGGGAERATLFDGDWLPDSDVRWLDARTVSINGWLHMPFVDHAIDTGSPQTTGTAIDSNGYVRNTIAPGERTVMLSGLSVVLPDGLSGQLLTRRASAAGQPWQRLLPDVGVPWSIASLHDLSETPSKRITSGRLIGRSRNGHVEARWNPAAHSITVVTRLSVGTVGLIWERRVKAADADVARQRVDSLWRKLSVEGARLPW